MVVTLAVVAYLLVGCLVIRIYNCFSSMPLADDDDRFYTIIFALLWPFFGCFMAVELISDLLERREWKNWPIYIKGLLNQGVSIFARLLGWQG